MRNLEFYILGDVSIYFDWKEIFKKYFTYNYYLDNVIGRVVVKLKVKDSSVKLI